MIAADKTIWDVHLDCTVLDVPESEWESLSRELSLRLEEILGDKKAWEYYDVLKTGRAGHKRYLKICEEVEDSVAEALRKAPILNKDQFEGGGIFMSRQIRSYPFGSLGRQTIGHPHPEYPTGIEGAFNAVLCGDTGKVEYVFKLRKGKYVRKDISRIESVNGRDVNTTLNMDLMAVCDSELRTALSGCRDVKYACAVLTETGSGALRSMVNLLAVPEKVGEFEEMINIAVGNNYEPGRVLTQFPSEVLEKGLEKMSFDFRWLPPAVVRASEDDGSIRVLCTPLYVSRIFGGIANDGVMFDPYLVTPSTSNILCSPAVADSLKAAMKDGFVSTMPVAHSCTEGENPYRYPSGEREFSTTWAGFFTVGGVEYVLVVAAFSDRTMLDAPQSDIPEKAAGGIMDRMLEK